MKLNKFILFISLYINCLSAGTVNAQTEDHYNLFIEFANLNKAGDFIGAEKCMLSVLNSEKELSPDYAVAAYNNLGLIKKNLGFYTEALNFYDKAETLLINGENISLTLAAIYINKSRIYTFRKSFPTAIEFLEKAIRVYKSVENPDSSLLFRISTACLNLGIVYYESGEYRAALNYLGEALKLKIKYNLPAVELAYLNLAKVYARQGENLKAEEYFNKCIQYFEKVHGRDHYRLAEVFFDYGHFLRSAGRLSESIKISRRALAICRKNYGEKHPYVSLSLRNIGDHFQFLNSYDSALYYYQESIIATVENFSDNSINRNPSPDSLMPDVELLRTLTGKAETLELLANQSNMAEDKRQLLKLSLGTIELALELMNRIRNNYPDEESRIYLAENEKETWLFAVHIAGTLYTLTGETSVMKKMYDIARNAKAAVLRNEITGNELFYTTGIPDSLREEQYRLQTNIAAYNNLIHGESVKPLQDTSKLSLWKDAIFEMNRNLEKLNVEINRMYPRFNNLLQKTEPVPLSVIQKNLHRDETIIDYILSNQYKKRGRDLYIFLITGDNIQYYRTSLDSGFKQNAEIIRNIDQVSSGTNFREYTGALRYMYGKLVKPVEESFPGRKLKIIPDEEIGWLPFDAFLSDSLPEEKTDYEELQYLIQKYTISYGHSSSMISGVGKRFKRRTQVFAFSPDYSVSNSSNAKIDTLRGAAQEIGSIYKWFRGKKYTGDQASETNFIKLIGNPAIFHLAMHSISDTLNSKYSYLMFDTRSDTIADGKLYNYEISLTRITSPMVVLSACNSGTGTLYHGEGLMSLARGFTLAGASSVIRTAWEVNDETSAKIISRFYYHLSKGRHKDDALRLAKLNYLEASPPAFASPYFWAAYEVLGDNTPVAIKFSTLALIICGGGVLSGFILFLYFRRRRILTDRSL
jgi:CHAT domain-containing protein/Tfp pilus assembly protein PilF